MWRFVFMILMAASAILAAPASAQTRQETVDQIVGLLREHGKIYHFNKLQKHVFSTEMGDVVITDKELKVAQTLIFEYSSRTEPIRAPISIQAPLRDLSPKPITYRDRVEETWYVQLRCVEARGNCMSGRDVNNATKFSEAELAVNDQRSAIRLAQAIAHLIQLANGGT
jgi:hypothetical protein